MRRLVIGIGNPDRGDDGAGLAAARALSEKAPDGVSVVELRGEPATLIDAWTKADVVFLIDACSSGAEAGAIRRFAVHERPLPEHFGAVSTHGFGVAATIELARAMDALPKSLVVYGIEACSFQAGWPLSAPVARAVEDVVARILAELFRVAA